VRDARVSPDRPTVALYPSSKRGVCVYARKKGTTPPPPDPTARRPHAPSAAPRERESGVCSQSVCVYWEEAPSNEDIERASTTTL
jgi:hypothetical protein